MQHKAEKLIGQVPFDKTLASLYHRRTVASFATFHAIANDYAPVALLEYKPKPGTDSQVRYSLRSGSKQPYFMPIEVKVGSPKYWLNSYIPRMTEAWNELDKAVQLIRKPQQFKEAVNMCCK